MKPTQLAAWAAIQDSLPASRWKVLRVIIDNPGMTALEIEKTLGFQGRRSNSRINELEKQGMIEARGVKTNPETGLAALCWYWTERDRPEPLPKRKSLRDELEELRTRLAQVEARVTQ